MKIDKNSDDYIYYQARYNIKKYRQKVGITANELSIKAGFGHQFIRNLESLKLVVRPRLDSLNRIAKALDIDIKQLFDEIEEEDK